MPDLELIRRLVDQVSPNGFGLTGALRHADAERLAQRWLPLIRFHEDERFHPVELRGLAEVPRSVFDSVPAATQGSIEVEVRVPDAAGVVGPRSFPPPVLSVPNPQGGGRLVLNETVPLLSGFSDGLVGREAKLTHGPGFTPSNAIFGSVETVSGLAEPSSGDPRLPKHAVHVTAELRMVLESLVHALRLVMLKPPDEYPGADDSAWNVADLTWSFFDTVRLPNDEQPDPFPIEDQMLVLLGILEGDPAAPAGIPRGWVVLEKVLATARNCVILEYHLVYAYNDYDKYEPWPANYHEGDDEGFCLVFDRRDLEQAVATGDPDAVVEVAPLHTITSVHLERQSADRIKDFDVLSQNEVFVARGSHATYLTPGSHDFMSFGETFEEVLEVAPTWVWVVSLGVGVVLVGLLAAVVEHFRDSNDETSEGGVAGGNPSTVTPDMASNDRFVDITLSTTPLSRDRHIYQASSPATPAQNEDLGLLIYSGTIGAHNLGMGKDSPHYKRKTSRFFRKLIQSGRTIV